jgi:hypothetical protein
VAALENVVILAGPTGLEPATSGVTGRRSNQLNYDPAIVGISANPLGGNCIPPRRRASYSAGRWVSIVEEVGFVEGLGGRVLRRERGVGQAPVDGQLRVVPEEAAVAGLVPEGGAFVEDLGVFAEDGEAVGELRGDPEHVVVVCRQLGGRPFAEGGGAAADVDGDVEDAAAGAADELSLGLLELVVEAAHDPTGGVGVVVLREGVGEAVGAVGVGVERFHEPPAGVAADDGFEEQHFGEVRLGDLQARRMILRRALTSDDG